MDTGTATQIVNDYAAWVTALATFGLLVATGVLAYLTHKLAQSTGAPQVVVSIEPNRWSFRHIDYVMTNVGHGAAFDVRVSIDPGLKAFKADSKEKSLPFDEVSTLKPGLELRSFMGEFNAYKDVNVAVTVSWARRPGGRKREKLTYKLSLTHLHEVHSLGDGNGDPLVAISRHLKALKEKGVSVHNTFGKKLNIDTFNAEDREVRAEAERKRYEEFRARQAKQGSGQN